MNILGTGIDAIEVININNLVINKDDVCFKNIQLSKIKIGKYQPRNRSNISTDALNELINSIKENGVLQPIIVRELVDDSYELIAGERRYLAAQKAQLAQIPCIIKFVNEKEAQVIALVENIQREQLTSLEESEALFKLKESHKINVEELAILVGKPRTTIANLIRVSLLASLKAKILCEQKLIDFGHLRAVLTLTHEEQEALLEYTVKNRLSVRALENLVRNSAYLSLLNKRHKEEDNIKEEYTKIINKLSLVYGLPVKLKIMSSGKIRVVMDFDDMTVMKEYLESKIDRV